MPRDLEGGRHLRILLVGAIASSLMLCAGPSTASQLKICLDMSRQMNRELPRRIDHLTVLKATSCVEDGSKVFFQYVHTISNPSALPRDIQKQSKDEALRQYCSNQGFRDALRLLSFDFYYIDSNNRPIYSFSIKKSDCR
jgi:hypothetical protein